MIRPAWTLPAGSVYLSTKSAASMASALVFTVSGVYLVTVVGLNPLQLVLVGTALEAAVFLFEVPTGVVADVYSRRLSIIIGMFLMGAGFVLWGAVQTFAAALAAQVVWGVGHTFASGADTAWIGVVATTSSVRTALVAAGLLLSPALALYARAIRRDGEGEGTVGTQVSPHRI